MRDVDDYRLSCLQEHYLYHVQNGEKPLESWFQGCYFVRGHLIQSVQTSRGRQELGTGTFLDSWLTSSGTSRHTSTSACEKCGSKRDKHGVIISCLECFLSDCPLYRFTYGESTAIFLAKARGETCTLALSDPPETVLHRAYYLLNNGFGCYHIFRNNCEDFAMYCKTGLLIVNENRLGTSGQAVSFLGAPLAAICSSPINVLMSEPLGMAVAMTGMYCLSRYYADLGNRKDVAKVPVEALAARIRPFLSELLQA
ncbi:hypothetical protein KP509_29G062300 [Ceratopteris richardii]|uniref:LRAT domain-containing protein n=1 Tax=Ceratopteris richardii TaxID=49495 RepID=A0A8T2R8H5_CERRI|nr:hypothetical protein KP509_29G062300 [Ceratopteris richardii]